MSQKKKFVFTVDVKGFSPIPPEIKSNELSVYVEILKPGKKAKSYHLGPEKLMILGSSLVLSNKVCWKKNLIIRYLVGWIFCQI